MQFSLPPHPAFSYPNFHPSSSSSTAMSTNPLDYPVTSFSQPGFSDGSLQYTDHENRHFLDHGGSSSSRLQLGLSSTPFTGSTGPNATGLVISGSTSNIDVFRNQNIPNSNPPSWQWTPASSGRGQPDSAQLPTPAAMAVLLNPRSNRTTQISSALPVPTAEATRQPRPPPPQQINTDLGAHPIVDAHSREKKHACWMCHKSFDRPSTLRKHLLVHTGEKAFVCDTCGRRFGVASNLNRHVRRCILKPVNTANANTPSAASNLGSPTSPSSANPIGSSGAASTELALTDGAVAPQSSSGGVERANKNKRTRGGTISPTSSNTSNSSATSAQLQTLPPPPPPAPRIPRVLKDPAPKRRRRAPSPSQWIPLSLLAFNLTPDEFHKSCPVPLAPVSPHDVIQLYGILDERDSWDENVGSAPYHPRDWERKHKLPGPGLGLGLGLGAKDVGNMNFSGGGGFMIGRVILQC